MEWKIGVIIDSLKLGVRKGIEKAAEIGADGFQIYITDGEMAPENMSKQDRADFKKLVRGLNLEISALCEDLFKGLLDRETNTIVVSRSKKFIDLAIDLETRIVPRTSDTSPTTSARPSGRSEPRPSRSSPATPSSGDAFSLQRPGLKSRLS